MPFNSSGIVYNLTGFLYLRIRYRNKTKVKEVLKKKYDNRYYDAGARLVMSIFGTTLISLMLLFLFAIIGRIIYDLIV